LYVKIGMVINVYPVGVPGAKKLGQDSLDWGLASSMSSSHKEVLHLTLVLRIARECLALRSVSQLQPQRAWRFPQAAAATLR